MERGFEEVEFFFVFSPISLSLCLSLFRQRAHPSCRRRPRRAKLRPRSRSGESFKWREKRRKSFSRRGDRKREKMLRFLARETTMKNKSRAAATTKKKHRALAVEREREREAALPLFFFFSPIAPPLPCPLCSHCSFLNHPNPLRTAQAAKASRLSGKASSEAATFEQMQGGRHAPPTRKFPVGTSLSLLPCISLKAQVFLCKKCGTIAAFANSFLPLVCHLWELRRDKEKKRKGSRGKKTTSKKKSQYGRPCEGVWVLIFF